MDKKFEIKIFKPPDFEKFPLDLKHLNKITGKNWFYASKGRWALYHILKHFKVKNKILIPAYLCETVLEPLSALNIEPVFYDIDKRDLNPDIESVDFMLKKSKAKCVLVPSLYGFPANLKDIEKLCKEKNVLMIDDAAQSFGAKLEDKFVGTFADAGFFSFSPGKATAGHMGAFFWCEDKEINIKRNNHCFNHKITYLDFYFNRLRIYNKKTGLLGKTFSLMKKISSKFIDIKNDDICGFERPVLGGILNSLLDGDFDFRVKHFSGFDENFKGDGLFQVVKSIRGVACPHKFVLLAHEKEISKSLIQYLANNKIYSRNGYNLLTNNVDFLPNTKHLNKRIIEIPIENDNIKMKRLFDLLQEFNV